MTLRLVFRRRVGADLSGAFQWYEQQRPGLGEEFLESSAQAFEAIRWSPQLCARVYGEVRRALVQRFPYGVFYRIEAHQVIVLAVLHTARNPQSWPRG